MKEYLKRILECDMSIVHGVYEPPNNIPILRYKVKVLKYRVIVIGNTSMKLSCINWLKTEEIEPTYVFDEPEELNSIDKRFNYFLVVADETYKYTSYQSRLINSLINNGIEDYICPYDFEKHPKHDVIYLEYFKKNRENILNMLDLLHDDESKRVYVEYIRTKMFCDFYRLKQNPTWLKYFDNNVYTHQNDEVFLNCGASNGDTIFYFLEKYNTFKRILAIEADKKRYQQLLENLNYFNDDVKQKISCICSNIDENNSLDSLGINQKISLINMDIEGMELKALEGSHSILKDNLPVVAACAYHLPTDLYELPLFFKNISDEYEIFYRKYASTFRNKFCNAELVMYAVPKKRLVK